MMPSVRRFAQPLFASQTWPEPSQAGGDILPDASAITNRCKGQRLTGSQARERVIAIIDWLLTEAAIQTVADANALLAAGWYALRAGEPTEAALLLQFQSQPLPSPYPTSPCIRAIGSAHEPTGRAYQLIGRADDLADLTQSRPASRHADRGRRRGQRRAWQPRGNRLVQSADTFADGVWIRGCRSGRHRSGAGAGALLQSRQWISWARRRS